MATNPNRRQFFLGLITALLGLWASHRALRAVPADGAPLLAAAPRPTCPHPRVTTHYAPANRLLTTTYDAGPCPRCRARAPLAGPSAFVYDGRAQPRA
jgi:hypothetical protein